MYYESYWFVYFLISVVFVFLFCEVIALNQQLKNARELAELGKKYKEVCSQVEKEEKEEKELMEKNGPIENILNSSAGGTFYGVVIRSDKLDAKWEDIKDYIRLNGEENPVFFHSLIRDVYDDIPYIICASESNVAIAYHEGCSIKSVVAPICDIGLMNGLRFICKKSLGSDLYYTITTKSFIDERPYYCIDDSIDIKDLRGKLVSWSE